jgi:hypothetical protein
LNEKSWPEPPGQTAFSGLAGKVVDALLPHTEADPLALLYTFLGAFGIAVGPSPHTLVGATRHTTRLFTVLVGQSAKARKGDSAHAVLALFDLAAPTWVSGRVVSGLSSGEGLIWAVRDPILRRDPIKEKGRITGYEDVEIDGGERDKRLLVKEPEFARVLKVMSRQGSTLSPILRDAWDTGDLRSLTKNSPAKATGAHIGILAHITDDELRRELADSEMTNGFANRFSFALVKRSKLLPEPEPLDGETLQELAIEVARALEAARRTSLMVRSDEARGLWREVYPELSADRPGLVGSLLARAEAQVLRLSMIYALLDKSAVIEVEHLASALELWAYSERSVINLFGDATGDPVADAILQALRSNGQLTRTQINDLFGRHESAARLAHALQVLLGARLASVSYAETGGRPVEIWRPS